MKRKDFDDVDDDFFSPSFKSRRLGANLFGSINGDPKSADLVFEEMPSPGTSVMQTDDLPKEELLATSGDDEKALVVYNPANSRLFKAPDSRDFSVIVNSDMIPGLRDHIYSWGNSKSLKPLKPVEDRVAVEEGEKREDSNGCLAVVPWVPSNFPLPSRDETQAASQSVAMEAEDIEMMDTDTGYNGIEVSELGRVNDGSGGGLQHWQQQQLQLHWMEPQRLQNNYTPVT